jgi:uncharacterized protein
MTTPDLLYIALIAAVMIIDHFVLWRRFVRRSQHDPVRARVRLWMSWMTMLWILTIVGLVLWVREHRNWSTIRIALPHGLRLLGAIGLVLAVALIQGRSIIKIMHSSHEKRARIRGTFRSLAAVLPHSGSDLRVFMPLSVTAGFCEEFLFRGYLLWAFQLALGLWGAVVLSAMAFAAGHAYQGVKGVSSAGIVGALLSMIVLGFDSLWPAIALHSLFDIAGGLTAWLTLREDGMCKSAITSCDSSVL